MSDEQWRFPKLTPREVFRWGTVIFVLVLYVLVVITFVLSLIGAFG